MNNNKRPFIEDMYGYTNVAYHKLLSSALYTQLVTSSGLSLTLTNNLVNDIITTYNKKRRRKLIDVLYDSLNTTKIGISLPTPDDCTKLLIHPGLSNLLRTVIVILYSYSCIYIKPRNVPLRIIHNGNAPWYTALVVGDSKHYSSCLKSGVVKSNINTYEYGESDWLELASSKGTESHRGCNHEEYVSSEIWAFRSGCIMYLTAGEACYESRHSKGFYTRIRVHVVTESLRPFVTHESNYAMFLVDAVYGNRAYVVQLLQLLHDTYPGRVYLTSHYKSRSYTNLKLGNELTSFTQQVSSVYSDYECSGYLLLNVGEYAYGPKYTLESNHYTHVINTQSGTTIMRREHIRSAGREHADVLKVEHSVRYNSYKPSESAMTQVYLNSHWELSKIAEYYGKRVLFNDKYASTYVHHPFDNTRIVVGYNTIRWEYRSVPYAILIIFDASDCMYCSTLVKTTGNRRYVYNWVTDRWDVGLSNADMSKPQYRIQRKRFYKVLQYMPKSLKRTSNSTPLPF